MPHGRILGVQQTLRTLVQLHAELGGKINDNRKQAEQLTADMMAVEKVIKLFDPKFNIQGIAAKRRNRTNKHFKRGTMFNTALNVLRRAGRPLSAREIAKQMLQERGVTRPNGKLIAGIIAGIYRPLKRRSGNGMIRNAGQTPAYNLTIRDGQYLGSKEPKLGVIKIAEEASYKITLGPNEGSEHLIGGPDTSAVKSEIELTKIANGALSFYIEGIVDYIDAFKKPRWTKFKFVYFKDCVKDGGVAFCEDGNDSN